MATAQLTGEGSAGPGPGSPASRACADKTNSRAVHGAPHQQFRPCIRLVDARHALRRVRRADIRFRGAAGFYGFSVHLGLGTRGPKMLCVINR
jgi:hypothetical protein